MSPYYSSSYYVGSQLLSVVKISYHIVPIVPKKNFIRSFTSATFLYSVLTEEHSQIDHGVCVNWDFGQWVTVFVNVHPDVFAGSLEGPVHADSLLRRHPEVLASYHEVDRRLDLGRVRRRGRLKHFFQEVWLDKGGRNVVGPCLVGHPVGDVASVTHRRCVYHGVAGNHRPEHVRLLTYNTDHPA